MVRPFRASRPPKAVSVVKLMCFTLQCEVIILHAIPILFPELFPNFGNFFGNFWEKKKKNDRNPSSVSTPSLLDLVSATPEILGSDGQPLKQTGLHVHESTPWLAGSPDGLVGTEGMVEAKCPYWSKTPHQTIPLYYYLQIPMLKDQPMPKL